MAFGAIIRFQELILWTRFLCILESVLPSNPMKICRIIIVGQTCLREICLSLNALTHICKIGPSVAAGSFLLDLIGKAKQAVDFFLRPFYIPTFSLELIEVYG